MRKIILFLVILSVGTASAGEKVDITCSTWLERSEIVKISYSMGLRAGMGMWMATAAAGAPSESGRQAWMRVAAAIAPLDLRAELEVYCNVHPSRWMSDAAFDASWKLAREKGAPIEKGD